MEITNEIKAMVFAQYLGKYMIFEKSGRLNTLYGVNLSNDTVILFDGEKQYDKSIWDFKLRLRPLDEITDEDALSAYAVYYGYRSGEHTAYARAVITTLAVRYNVYQFLQSKGYDLPNYLLDGKTLCEAGLAIYAENISA